MPPTLTFPEEWASHLVPVVAARVVDRLPGQEIDPDILKQVLEEIRASDPTFRKEVEESVIRLLLKESLQAEGLNPLETIPARVMPWPADALPSQLPSNLVLHWTQFRPSTAEILHSTSDSYLDLKRWRDGTPPTLGEVHNYIQEHTFEALRNGEWVLAVHVQGPPLKTYIHPAFEGYAAHYLALSHHTNFYMQKGDPS